MIAVGLSDSLIRTGFPPAAMRSSNSASGGPRAAAGMSGSSACMAPACGERLFEVESERNK